jgi:hypothetical protein
MGVVKTRNAGYHGIWPNITEYAGISRNIPEYQGISRNIYLFIYLALPTRAGSYHDIFPEYIGIFH